MKKTLLYFLTFCFCLEFQHPASAGGDDEDNKKNYILINIADLNTGSELPMSSEFISNDDECNNLLTTIAVKAKKFGDKALPILPYITAVTGLGLYVLYVYNTSTTCDPDATEPCDPDTQFSLIGVASSVTGSYLFGQMFAHKLSRKFTELQQNYLPKVWQSKGYITILEYKETVDENFKNGKITKKQKNIFYEQLAEYKSLIPYYKEEEKPIKSCREKMKKISLLATELKKIDYDEIEPRLLEFLDTYPGEVKEKILDFIVSVADESTADAPHTKNIICFYGEPGTGKTALAQELAKILGVSMTSFEPSSHKAEEMIAEHGIDENQKEIMLNSSTEKKNNFLNNILFIDEFDKCLEKTNEHAGKFDMFYKKILEKGQGYYTSGKIDGLVLDMSATIIILACNNMPTSGAIGSRIDPASIIKFEKIPADKQLLIAHKSFEAEINRKHKYLENPDENYKVLQQIVDKNPNPGVRELKNVVSAYITHISKRNLKNIEFDIDKAYGIKPKENEIKIEEVSGKKEESNTLTLNNFDELFISRAEKMFDIFSSKLKNYNFTQKNSNNNDDIVEL